MTEQELMLTAILNCRRVDLYLRPEVELDAAQTAALSAMRERRAAGEPLQYILGSWDFHGLTLKTDPRALIPRPETEGLVEHLLQIFASCPRPVRVLDVGTGSGNIAVALAKCLPEARVTAVDISSGALALARENAAQAGVAERIDFILADLLTWLADGPGEDGPLFDIVAANPPYIPTGDLPSLPPEVLREPLRALDGGPDGLRYIRHIIAAAPAYLAAGGRLALEIGDGQADAVQSLLQSRGAYDDVNVLPDYTGTGRTVVATRRF